MNVGAGCSERRDEGGPGQGGLPVFLSGRGCGGSREGNLNVGRAGHPGSGVAARPGLPPAALLAARVHGQDPGAVWGPGEGRPARAAWLDFKMAGRPGLSARGPPLTTGPRPATAAGRDLQDLHLQGAQAGAPRHRYLLQGHVHHELGEPRARGPCTCACVAQVRLILSGRMPDWGPAQLLRGDAQGGRGAGRPARQPRCRQGRSSPRKPPPAPRPSVVARSSSTISSTRLPRRPRTWRGTTRSRP